MPPVVKPLEFLQETDLKLEFTQSGLLGIFQSQFEILQEINSSVHTSKEEIQDKNLLKSRLQEFANTPGVTLLKNFVKEVQTKLISWESTRLFQNSSNNLYSNDTYWQYLMYRTLLNNLIRDLNTEKKALQKRQQELEEEKRQLEANKPQGILNGIQLFFNISTGNKYTADYLQAMADYDKKAKVFNDDFKKYEKKLADHNEKIKPFLALEENFPKQAWRHSETKTPLPEKFSLDDNTKKYLESHLTSASLKTAFSDQKDGLPIHANSIKQKWQKHGTFSHYNSNEILAYSAYYLTPMYDYIQSAKEELRANTQPKGLVENIKYFFNRIVFGKKLENETVTQLIQQFKEKEQEIVSQQKLLLESMVTRLEAADQRTDLNYDDVTLDLYYQLNKFNAAPYKVDPIFTDPKTVLPKGAQVEDTQVTKKGLAVNPRRGLTPELIKNFREQVQVFSQQHTDHRDKNKYIARGLKDRINRLDMFRLPDNLKNMSFNHPVENEISNDPVIWLAFNSLEKKFNQAYIGEHYLLDNIMEDGQLPWLSSAVRLFSDAKAHLQEYEKKYQQYFFPPKKLNFLLDSIKIKFTKLENSLTEKIKQLADQAIKESQKEIADLLDKASFSNETIMGNEIETLVKHLDNARKIVNYYRGNKDLQTPVVALNPLPIVIFYLRQAKVRSDNSAKNFLSIARHILPNEHFETVLKILDLALNNFIPTNEKEFIDLENELFSLFNDEKETQNFLADIAKNYFLTDILSADLFSLRSDLTVLKDKVAFIKNYLPDGLTALLTVLNQKINEFKGENDKLAITTFLFGTSQNIIDYCTKRFVYLLEHRTDQKGGITEIDEWFFKQVFASSSEIANNFREKIIQTINSNANYTHGDDSKTKNDELVKMAMLLGNMDIIKILHEKIIRGIHSNPHLGENGKRVAIKSYLNALQDNARHISAENQQSLEKFSDNLLQTLAQEENSFSDGNLPLYTELYTAGYISQETHQLCNTKYLLYKINSGYHDFKHTDTAWSVYDLESEYGKIGVTEILSAIKSRIESQKRYHLIGIGVIHLASEITTEEVAMQYPMAQKIHDEIKIIIHDNQMDMVKQDLSASIYNELNEDNFSYAIELINLINEDDFIKALKKLSSSTLIELDLNNDMTLNNFIDAFKHNTNARCEFKQTIEQSFKMHFLEKLKSIFSPEHIQSSSKTYNWEEGSQLAQEEAEKLLAAFKDKIHNQKLYEKLAQEVENFQRKHSELYIDLSRYLSADLELEKDVNLRFSYGKSITLENAETLRDSLNRDNLLSIAKRVLDKIMWLERVKTLDGISDNEIKIEEFNMQVYQHPTSTALRAFYNVITEKVDPSSHEKRTAEADIALLESFPAFHQTYITIEAMLADPLMAEKHANLLRSQNTDQFKDSSPYNDSVFWHKLIDRCLENGIGSPIKSIIDTFGTDEQKKNYNQIAVDSKTVSEIIKLLNKFAELKNFSQLENKLKEKVATLPDGLKFVLPSVKMQFNLLFSTLLNTAIVTQQHRFLRVLKTQLLDQFSSLEDKNKFDQYVANEVHDRLEQTSKILDPKQSRINIQDENFFKLKKSLDENIYFIQTFGNDDDRKSLKTKLDRLLYCYLERNCELAYNPSNYPGSEYIKTMLYIGYRGISEPKRYDNYVTALATAISGNNIQHIQSVSEKLLGLLNKENPTAFEDYQRISEFRLRTNNFDDKVLTEIANKLDAQHPTENSHLSILLSIRNKLANGLISKVITTTNLLSEQIADQQLNTMGFTEQEKHELLLNKQNKAYFSFGNSGKNKAETASSHTIHTALFTSAVLHSAYLYLRDIDPSKESVKTQTNLIGNMVATYQKQYELMKNSEDPENAIYDLMLPVLRLKQAISPQNEPIIANENLTKQLSNK